MLSELTSEAGLDEKFEQAHITQNEPLILTYDGVVANGNRRLTCWRNLYHSKPDKYSHYAHVDVVILPQCEERDIVRLEATLQLEKDIRGPYGWATQAIGLRRAVNPPFDMSHQEAASLYAVGKVSDVQRRIDELNMQKTTYKLGTCPTCTLKSLTKSSHSNEWSVFAVKPQLGHRPRR